MSGIGVEILEERLCVRLNVQKEDPVETSVLQFC